MDKIRFFDFGAGILVGALGVKIVRNIFSSIGQAIRGVFKTILTGPRKLFNELVSTGHWDFWAQTDAVEQEFRNSKTLYQWLYRYSKTHTYTGPLLSGHIYAFDYSPLDKTQAYDISPIVLSFGTYAANTGNLVEYGVNLHWLPLEIRKAFVADVFNYIKDTYKGQFYSNEPRPIDAFNYETLRPYVTKYHIDYAVRAYVKQGRMHTIVIDYQDWPKACIIPSKGFMNFDESELRHLYTQHVIRHKGKTMQAKQRMRNNNK